jgi:hypothetical protein
MVHCDEMHFDAYSHVGRVGHCNTYSNTCLSDYGSGSASDDDLSDVYVGNYSPAEVTQLLRDMGVSAEVTSNIMKQNVDGGKFLDCSNAELSHFLCDEHSPEDSTHDLRILSALQTYLRQTLQAEEFYIDNGEW